MNNVPSIPSLFFFFLFCYLLQPSTCQPPPSLRTRDCTRPDFCYAIDESSSISRRLFRSITTALVNFTEHYDQKHQGSFFSAIGFSNVRPSLIYPLTNDVKSFVGALIRNNARGGNTFIGIGLHACRNLLIRGRSRAKIIVLLSDGLEQSVRSRRRRRRRGNRLLGADVAPKLKNQGFILVSVGVKRNPEDPVSISFLNSIASDVSLSVDLKDISSLIHTIPKFVGNTFCANQTANPIPSISSNPSVVANTPSPSASVTLTASGTPPSTPSFLLPSTSVTSSTPVTHSTSSTPSSTPSLILPSGSASNSDIVIPSSGSSSPSMQVVIEPSLTPSPSNSIDASIPPSLSSTPSQSNENISPSASASSSTDVITEPSSTSTPSNSVVATSISASPSSSSNIVIVEPSLTSVPSSSPELISSSPSPSNTMDVVIEPSLSAIPSNSIQVSGPLVSPSSSMDFVTIEPSFTLIPSNVIESITPSPSNSDELIIESASPSTSMDIVIEPSFTSTPSISSELISSSPLPSIIVSPTVTPSVSSIIGVVTLTPNPTESIFASPSSEEQEPCNTIDLCFAIDETSSIPSDQFALQSDALIDVSRRLASLSPGSRFSATGFSSSATIVSELTSDIEKFEAALQSNVQSDGSTSSGSGLLRCASLLPSETAASRKRLIVLVTDGEDNVEPFGETVAPRLKSAQFIIATLGIGQFASEVTLRKSIASTPDLYMNVSRYEQFPLVSAGIVSKFCALPEPMKASVSPSVSPTPRPLAPPAIMDVTDLPPFDENASDAQNVEVLRQNFEFFVGESLGFNSKIRVESDLVSATSPIFPWNIIDEDANGGKRFLWPLQSPSNSPVILPNVGRQEQPQQDRQDQLVTVERQTIQCLAQQCAAKVTVFSEKFIRWTILNNAFKKIRQRPSFQNIYDTDRRKVKIIRQARRRFAVFIPLLNVGGEF